MEIFFEEYLFLFIYCYEFMTYLVITFFYGLFTILFSLYIKIKLKNNLKINKHFYSLCTICIVLNLNVLLLEPILLMLF